MPATSKITRLRCEQTWSAPRLNSTKNFYTLGTIRQKDMPEQQAQLYEVQGYIGDSEYEIGSPHRKATQW